MQKARKLCCAGSRANTVCRASIIVAVWGRESGFGRAKIPHSAVRVLVTKAFMSTRPDLFRAEILAALQILQRGDVAASAL
jgi:membrane-bound lytic murein transglycosylase B